MHPITTLMPRFGGAFLRGRRQGEPPPRPSSSGTGAQTAAATLLGPPGPDSSQGCQEPNHSFSGPTPVPHTPEAPDAMVGAAAHPRQANGKGLIRARPSKPLPEAALGETAPTTRRPPPSRSPCQQPQGLAVLQDLVGEGVQGRFGISGVEFCDDHHTLVPHAAVCNR